MKGVIVFALLASSVADGSSEWRSQAAYHDPLDSVGWAFNPARSAPVWPPLMIMLSVMVVILGDRLLSAGSLLKCSHWGAVF